MQELASQGGGLLDRDLLSNNGDWSGIVASFAVMKRLSGGRDKDNKLRFSKTSSLGDYQTLLWSLFDAGMLYFILCTGCGYLFLSVISPDRTKMPEISVTYFVF